MGRRRHQRLASRLGALRRHGRRDDGATAVEYALIASLIAVTIATSVTLFGQAVIALFAQMPAGL